MIVDGHPAHKAKSVIKLIESEPVKKRFRLFYLPPYFPELNPDERIWNDLKNNAVGKQSMTAPDQIQSAVISHLGFIQKPPNQVRSYFNNTATNYAA